jgi:hypothetical protein
MKTQSNTSIIKTLRVLSKQEKSYYKVNLGIKILLSQNPTDKQLHEVWSITEDAMIAEALGWFATLSQINR